MPTNSNIIWRTAKSGIATGASVWAAAYMILPVVLAAFNLPFIPLAIDIVGFGGAFAVGGFIGYKRYQALNIKQDERSIAHQELQETRVRLHDLGETLELDIASLQKNARVATPMPVTNNNKLKRSVKAFLSNFPVAKTLLTLTLGVSFLAITPVGWILVGASAAAAIGWGVASAIKKWQTIGIEEEMALQDQKLLAECEVLRAAVAEKLGPQANLDKSKLKNIPAVGAEKTLAANMEGLIVRFKGQYQEKGLSILLDDGIDFLGEAIGATFIPVVNFLKRNKAPLIAGVGGAAGGFAIVKTLFIIGLPLLATIGVAAPPVLVITGIAVACAVFIGFAVAKAKHQHLQQVENKITANKAVLESLKDSITALEQTLEIQVNNRPHVSNTETMDNAPANTSLLEIVAAPPTPAVPLPVAAPLTQSTHTAGISFFAAPSNSDSLEKVPTPAAKAKQHRTVSIFFQQKPQSNNTTTEHLNPPIVPAPSHFLKNLTTPKQGEQARDISLIEKAAIQEGMKDISKAPPTSSPVA
jgi:hypothetical protein